MGVGAGLGAGDAVVEVVVGVVVEVLAAVVVAELVVEVDGTELAGVPHRFGPPATKRRRTSSSTSTVCAQLFSGRMRRRKCPAVWRSHANFGNGAVAVLPGTSTEACARPKADDSPFARATHADSLVVAELPIQGAEEPPRPRVAATAAGQVQALQPLHLEVHVHV